jgi:hypothetical protein
MQNGLAKGIGISNGVNAATSPIAVSSTAGLQSPTLGTGAATEWPTGGANNANNANGNSNSAAGLGSPKDAWMCRMPKPGSTVPDRHGWELVRLVEQNSLMALMLGFMGALGRDRLRRVEAIRRTMEEEARLEEEAAAEEDYDEDYDEDDYREEDDDEYEEEDVYYDDQVENTEMMRPGPENSALPRTIAFNVEHVVDSTPGTEDEAREVALTKVAVIAVQGALETKEQEDKDDDDNDDDVVLSAISGHMRKVKGKEIWWAQ